MGSELVGQYPQTKQTWRSKPIRELFAEILSDHPTANEETLRRNFRKEALNDPDYMDAIIDYAFDAAWRAYERHSGIEIPTAQDRAEAALKKAEELKDHAEKVKYLKEQIILLNQEMPNGMRVRYCTLDYMYRLGGAYRRIGRQGSQKIVGETYDEVSFRRKLQGVT